MLSGCDDGDDGVSLPALEAADAWAVEDGELVLSSGEESLRVGAA